jgi:hypothetical protein
MRIVQAPRASAILYSILVDREDHRPWLLPANICPIVPLTFLKAKVPFEFVDISSETLHIDLHQAEEYLKRGTFGGLLYAHTYGELSTPNDFFQAIKARCPDVMIIDDRCLCVPDFKPPADFFADLALYSTGYAKYVDLDFGGYAFINESTEFTPVHLPYNERDYHALEGSYKRAVQSRSTFRYRDSDWLQTGGKLPAWNDYHQQIQEGLRNSKKQRVSLNDIYTQRLPVGIQLPQPYQNWRFNIRVKNQQPVLKAVFAGGLFASAHYASLAGIMVPGHCPRAEALAGEIINLFNDFYFDANKADRICSIILENCS